MTIVVGALLSLPALPAVANAASAPVVNWAHSVEDDLGTLEVSAGAEAGITALRAHIVSFVTGQDVGVVDDFRLVSGTEQAGLWHTANLVQLDQLGFYKVSVEATDGAGQHVLAGDIGTFTYLVRTAFGPLSAQPSTITYTQRSVRLSGTLTGTWPGNREVRPVGSVVVDIRGGVGQPVEVTTAADGSFVATVEPAANEFDLPPRLFAEFGGDPVQTYLLRANSDNISIALSPAKTKLTAKVSRAKVKAGESVTLSGQLTWRSPDGWQPLADQQIGVLFCVGPDNCPTSVDYPRTDADGRYQLTVTPWQTGFYQVGFGSPDPFIANALATSDIVVLRPAEFVDFTAARDASGAVVAGGHLRFGNFTPFPIPVRIQFKAAGTTTWTTVATVPDAEWDGTGYAFSATVAESRSGRWRAFYAGRPDFFQTAISPVVFVA